MRRLFGALVAMAVAGGIALCGAGPVAAQVTVVTVQTGYLPLDDTVEASTTCAAGTVVTGVVVHVPSGTAERPFAVGLTCSDGSTSSVVGGSAHGLPSEVGTPACGDGDRAIGLVGTSDHEIDALGVRCAGVGGATYDTPASGDTTSVPFEPAVCPAGTAMIGLNVWWAEGDPVDLLGSVQGVCGSVAAEIGNVGAADATPTVTECPLGSSAEGLQVHTLASGSFVSGVALACSDGSTSPLVGGPLNGGETVTPSSCQPGDPAIGLIGRSGEVLDALGVRCAGASDRYDGAVVGSSGGYVTGPTDCAGYRRLLGVVVWWHEYLGQDTVSGVAGLCAPESRAPKVGLDPFPVAALSSSVPIDGFVGDDTTGGSGVTYRQVRYRVSDRSGRLGAWKYPEGWQHLVTGWPTPGGLKPAATYCYSARAVDAAANWSAWSAARCTTRAVDDRALETAGGWRRVAAPRDWNRTATVTTSKGATLTYDATTTRQVGLVATTCPACGRVAIAVGGRTVGHLDLARRTARRVVLTTPRFPARSGPITVTVTSSGKSVEVDGVVPVHG